MKKKKILFIVLPIILVLIIVAVLAILYFTTDMFKRNDELFIKYFSQNEELFDIMKNDNANEQNNFKHSNSYTSSGELLFTMQNGNNIQEVKATTTSRYDLNTDRTYSEMNLKNGEADLLKISYINSDDVYAIKCDDILANYIGIRNSNLKVFAKNMGLPGEVTNNIPDSINIDAIINIGKMTEEQKQHIIDTYSKVIKESITPENFSKTNNNSITINGTNYNTNSYILTLDTNTIKQLSINYLNTLKEDNVTLSIISNKLSTLGINNEYIDITKLSENIKQLTEKVQNENMIEDITIEIAVYEYNGTTIRTDIKFLEAEKETVSISINRNNTENTKKVDITIKENFEANSVDITTGETNTSTTNTEISQITLQKTLAGTNIINDITIIPNTNNTAQSIEINFETGKIQNNKFSNINNITINHSSDGINIETINISYMQNTQAESQVEEIMELKNSNTVIVNNYTKEQILPFLTNIFTKAEGVISNKISQLGVNM